MSEKIVSVFYLRLRLLRLGGYEDDNTSLRVFGSFSSSRFWKSNVGILNMFGNSNYFSEHTHTKSHT